jgi:hypothetical protein
VSGLTIAFVGAGDGAVRVDTEGVSGVLTGEIDGVEIAVGKDVAVEGRVAVADEDGPAVGDGAADADGEAEAVAAPAEAVTVPLAGVVGSADADGLTRAVGEGPGVGVAASREQPTVTLATIAATIRFDTIRPIQFFLLIIIVIPLHCW